MTYVTCSQTSQRSDGDRLVPLAVALAELLELSAERDRQLELRHEAWRDAYRIGFEAGYRRGREVEDQQWFTSLAPARAAARILARSPGFDKLDKIRYPPGGRLSWLKKPGQKRIGPQCCCTHRPGCLAASDDEFGPDPDDFTGRHGGTQ